MTSTITASPLPRSAPQSHSRRVVHGHKLPDDRHELTSNERAWIELLRSIVGDADPPPTLAAVQALRQVLVE